MKKRLLSILLLCCMVLTLLPTAAFAEGSTEGASAEKWGPADDVPTQPKGETVVLNSEGETVIKLTQNNIGNYVSGLTNGSYQLGENVTVESGSLKVTGTVTLDLNGHTLVFKNPVESGNVKYYYGYGNEGTEKTETNPIGILVYGGYDQGALPYTLTLTDSSETKTGKLDIQGNGAKDATGIYVGRNCTLNIEGGTITNSASERVSSTGVLAVLGTVKMTGGSIESQAYGALLYGSNMTISDNAKISDCGYLDTDGYQTVSGVFAMRGYLATNEKSGIKDSNIMASTLTMTGGTISNCMSPGAGGGVYLEAESTFDMSGGTITGCKSGEDGVGFSSSHGGGGVYVGGTFNMSGSASITNCEATGSGGGVLVGGTFNMSGNAKITGCKAAAGGGGVYVRGDSSGQTTFTMSDSASITNCEAIGGCGGGVYLGQCTFTMKDTASITGCKATEVGGNIKDGDCIMIESSKSVTLNIADTVTIGGQISQYVGDTESNRMDGLGTEKFPYQIGTAAGLKWFRDIVNGDNGQTKNRSACAVLTADINLNDEEWTPIGKPNTWDNNASVENAYSGTFDGRGHTVSGLKISTPTQTPVGLFGAIQNATIKNLTVAGSVAGSTANDSVAGGIAGKATDSTIEACANLCGVFANQYVGGIVGMIRNTTVRDCYNLGEISGGSNAGGIVGMTATQSSNTIANCYNVGSVYASGCAGGILGYAGQVNASHCYYLKGTAQKAIDTVILEDIEVHAPKTVVEFADGTVLKLLIGDCTDSPWDSMCKYVGTAGRTLPVLTQQKLTVHDHDWGAWTSNGDGTRTHTCPCGVSETVNYSSSSSRTYYTIQATAGAGGAISPGGKVSVREGRNQVFTITPDQGYAVSDVRIDGESVGAVTSYTFENVRKAHTIAVSFAKVKVFVDVPAGSYYEDAVNWAVENGITQGTDDTHFSPDDVCTRAQMVTFLWRAAGSPKVEDGKNPFVDVKADAYYYDAVLWAVQQGVTSGTSATTFSPDATVTRGQTVTFLYRNAGSPEVTGTMPFTDVEADAYYAKAVLWAVEQKITTGTSETTFHPMNDCTRGQIVTFLYRAK